MFSHRGGSGQASAAITGLLEEKSCSKETLCVSSDSFVNPFLIFLAVCDYLCGWEGRRPYRDEHGRAQSILLHAESLQQLIGGD